MSLNAATLQLMMDKGLSLADVVEIAQAMEVRRDATAAERKRRQRRRERDERDMSQRDVTRDTLSPEVSPQTPLPNPIPSPPSPPKGGSSPQKTGHRLPSDWMPEPFPVGSAAREATEVWQPGRLERELSKFRDHWAAASGANARKHDWQAAWRNWALRADEQGPRNGRSDTLGGHRGNGEARIITAGRRFVARGGPPPGHSGLGPG